ncbi:MAG: hypothetical protein AAF468_17960 [Pseudomonadota bacterium]
MPHPTPRWSCLSSISGFRLASVGEKLALLAFLLFLGIAAGSTGADAKSWKPDKRVTPALKNAAALSKDIATDLNEYLKPLQDRRNQLESEVIWVIMDPKLDADRLRRLDSAVKNIQKLGKALKYLGYAGIAVDLIASFLPNDGDPTLKALARISDQIQSLSNRMDDQFEHTNDLIAVTALKQTVKTAISEINSDAAQLDAYSNKLKRYNLGGKTITRRVRSKSTGKIRRKKTKFPVVGFPASTGISGIKPDMLARKAALVGDNCSELFSKLMDETYGDYETLNMMGIYVLGSLINANRAYVSAYTFQAALDKRSDRKKIDAFVKPTSQTVNSATENAAEFVGKHYERCNDAFTEARYKLRTEDALISYARKYLKLRLNDIAETKKPARRIVAELKRLHPKHDWSALIYKVPERDDFHDLKGDGGFIMRFPNDKTKAVVINFIETERKIKSFRWWNNCGSEYDKFTHIFEGRKRNGKIKVFQDIGFSFKRWHFFIKRAVDVLDKICPYEENTSFVWVGVTRQIGLPHYRKIRESEFFTTNKKVVDIQVGESFAVLTVLDNIYVGSDGRWINYLPRFVLGESKRFGPLENRYADTKPISCKYKEPIGGVRLRKGGNRLFLSIQCPDSWRSKSKKRSDKNYFGPMENLYANSKAVECPRGEFVIEISLLQSGNRVTPKIVCAKPKRKTGKTYTAKWTKKYFGPLEDTYADTHKQVCPGNSFLAGFRLGKRAGRLTPRLFCRRLYN